MITDSRSQVHPARRSTDRRRGAPLPLRRRPSGPHRRYGFTLIEMLVATILLAVGVTAVLAAIGNSSDSTYTSDRLQQATLLAQQQLEQTEMQAGSLTAGDTSGNFSPTYPDITWHQNVQTTQYPNLYLVTLQVMWGPLNRPSMRQFVTYINSAMAQNIQTGLINGTTPAGSTTTGGSTNGGQ